MTTAKTSNSSLPVTTKLSPNITESTAPTTTAAPAKRRKRSITDINDGLSIQKEIDLSFNFAENPDKQAKHMMKGEKIKDKSRKKSRGKHKKQKKSGKKNKS